MSHTDINKKSFIAALPQFIQPYFYLMRLDRPIGIWLLLLPSLWGIFLAAGNPFAMNSYELNIMALFCIGSVIMRGAGCVINDLWDRDIDPKVERTAERPLASGLLKPWHASIFLLLLLLCGAVILFQMQIVTILLGFLVLPLIAVYPLMKRITWWPQAFLGITFNFGVLMGWSAISGVISFASLLIYIGAILWTIGYDTIYAHQDKNDDLAIGMKSTALHFGDQSKKMVTLFYGLAGMFMMTGFLLAQDHWWYAVLLLPALIFAGHTIRQWEPDDKTSSLKTFKSSRDVGLLILLAAIV